ncbi:MAG: adenosylcobinamide-GDP ribazoletransferase [Burkholderiales bacterium]|nr:adenosylcobinamide-GDP ribazoletransferase [Burkholderiales bacterium]
MFQAIAHELRLFFVAVQFLTRVPVPRWVGFEPAWLNDCVRYFPLVGVGIGAFASVAWWLAFMLWPPTVAVILSMAATLWLTGGFHEDGLSDTVDALGGAVSRERALLIMKDSRLGAYGAMALVVMLGLKASTLVGLARYGPWLPVLALLWAHTISRAAAVVLMRTLPYGGDVAHAKAKPLATTVSGTALWVSLMWGLVVTLAIGAAVPSVVMAIALLLGVLACGFVTVVCGRWFWRRLGGYTGDTLGATQQFTEVAALLAWLAVFNQQAVLLR